MAAAVVVIMGAAVAYWNTQKPCVSKIYAADSPSLLLVAPSEPHESLEWLLDQNAAGDHNALTGLTASDFPITDFLGDDRVVFATADGRTLVHLERRPRGEWDWTEVDSPCKGGPR